MEGDFADCNGEGEFSPLPGPSDRAKRPSPTPPFPSLPHQFKRRRTHPQNVWMYPRVPLDRSPLHFTQLSDWVCCRRLDPWQRRRPRCSLLKPPFVPKLNPFSSLRSVFPPLYSMRGVAAWQGGGERGLLGSTFLIKLPPSSPQLASTPPLERFSPFSLLLLLSR